MNLGNYRMSYQRSQVKEKAGWNLREGCQQKLRPRSLKKNCRRLFHETSSFNVQLNVDDSFISIHFCGLKHRLAWVASLFFHPDSQSNFLSPLSSCLPSFLSSCTMVENRKKHRQNSHLINHYPTSEGMSEVSERASK